MTDQPMGRCAYCKAERPLSELKEGTIIFRNRRSVDRKTNLYCKDKGCRGYDQMAHEG